MDRMDRELMNKKEHMFIFGKQIEGFYDIIFIQYPVKFIRGICDKRFCDGWLKGIVVYL